jgi:hypothetical protein
MIRMQYIFYGRLVHNHFAGILKIFMHNFSECEFGFVHFCDMRKNMFARNFVILSGNNDMKKVEI